MKFTYDVYYVVNFAGSPINDKMISNVDLNSAYRKMEQYINQDNMEGYTKRKYEIREHKE